MKRLFLLPFLWLTVAFACAQELLPAPVHPSPSLGKFIETPEMHNQRLTILTTEHSDTQQKLSTALIALQKSPNNKDAIDDVTRLQADLQALEREIARIEQRPNAAQPANKKPTATAGGELYHESKPDPNQTYESWDVFKNFPHKKVDAQ